MVSAKIQLKSNAAQRTQAFILCVAIGCFTSLGAIGLSAHAQTSRSTSEPSARGTLSVEQLAEDIRRAIPRLFPNDAAFEQRTKIIYGPNLTRQQTVSAMRLMKNVMLHPATPTYLGRLLHPFQTTDPKSPAFRMVMTEGLVSLQVQGLKRLDASTQETLIRQILALMKAVSPHDCARMLNGTMPTAESIDLERRHLLTQPQAIFDQVVDMYEAASIAELTDTPRRRSLSREQQQLASQVVEQRAGALMQERFTRAQIELYASNPQGAPAQLQCGMGMQMIEALLQVDEPYRGWGITSFVLQM